jgi:hypothetical protein
VEVKEYVSLSIDNLAVLIDRYKTDRSQSRPDVGEWGLAGEVPSNCKCRVRDVVWQGTWGVIVISIAT